MSEAEPDVWYCLHCGKPYPATSSTMDPNYSFVRCMAPGSKGLTQIACKTAKQAQEVAHAAKADYHTARHHLHVANRSRSRYCALCGPAMTHTLHVKWRKSNSDCHLCKPIPKGVRD